MSRTLRICRTCPSVNCHWREFGNPEAKCPEHGKGQDDPNRPYFGKPTPRLDREAMKA